MIEQSLCYNKLDFLEAEAILILIFTKTKQSKPVEKHWFS